MVDTYVSGAYGEICVGSSPISDTKNIRKIIPNQTLRKSMKNILKLFLIYVCFFISLSANACGIDFHAANLSSVPVITDSIRDAQNELSMNNDTKEQAIASANSQRQEISNISNRKNNFSGGSLDKAAAQQKLLQQIFTANYNKTLYSNSHKISSYLKNEICTRAP